ncbi:pyridoxal phosphate enzyme (YggS family) [Dysgonomonadaceae bacterium PH5-43]|nr:pyridoxal phosphate enzyme (YggS family) [Dysgonomonadaceae bacterium PH5-43]
MTIVERLNRIKDSLPANVHLVAVSKFHSNDAIMEAYNAGQRVFGESRVQEVTKKYEDLPKDINWHFIGHLQTNKVKYIAPFITMVHSADSIKLIEELNLCAYKNNRTIDILIQIHIAEEDTKSGFSYSEAESLFKENILSKYPFIKVKGLMGMATYTDNDEQVKKEFAGLSAFFNKIKDTYYRENPDFIELSMGMSDDYLMAVEKGSTMVRIGSKIFGERI